MTAVDYLSFSFNQFDLHQCWRNATKHKDSIVNGRRLENASWRKFFQMKFNLQTIDPSTLNWQKDSDVCWLYGPFYQYEPLPVLQASHQHSASRQGDSGEGETNCSSPTSCGNLKPVLKKRPAPDEIFSSLRDAYLKARSSSDPDILSIRDNPCRSSSTAVASSLAVSAVKADVNGYSSAVLQAEVPLGSNGSVVKQLRFAEQVEQRLILEPGDDASRLIDNKKELDAPSLDSYPNTNSSKVPEPAPQPASMFPKGFFDMPPKPKPEPATPTTPEKTDLPVSSDDAIHTPPIEIDEKLEVEYGVVDKLDDFISNAVDVFRLGTSSICDEKTFFPKLSNLSALVETVDKLRNMGHKVVLVSSGAVGVGLKKLKLDKRPKHLPQIQAVAAVGQGQLMALYDDLFGRYDIPIAQILLTRDNIAERSQYLNACNTFKELLYMNVVPIVNENDTVSHAEIRFGDNDSLSAIAAGMVNADYLFLCTDVECLYTDNPRTNPNAKAVRVVEDVSKLREQGVFPKSSHCLLTQPLTPFFLLWSAVVVSSPGSSLGTGGMVTKLIAADLATSAGVTTIITLGSQPQKIIHMIDEIAQHQRIRQSEYLKDRGTEDGVTTEWLWKGFEPSTGTYFLAKAVRMIDRKWWIAHGLQTHGAVFVDAGAARAVRDLSSSLFAAGIVKVVGNFSAQQCIRIMHVKSEAKVEKKSSSPKEANMGNEDEADFAGAEEIGKGIANYSSVEINRIKGCRSSKIEEVLGYMDSKVIAICGYGPGISRAVAERFGKDGYSIALLARDAEKLQEGVNQLTTNSIKAKSFQVDLEDEAAVIDSLNKVRGGCGPINILFWNAYCAPTASLKKTLEKAGGGEKTECWKDFTCAFRVCGSALVAAVEASCEDLKNNSGSILVTGDGLALDTPEALRMAIEMEWESLAVAKAAQSKLVSLLNEKLKKENIFVGQLIVKGKVKGTEYDKGDANLTGEQVAEKLYEMIQKRDKHCEVI
ncbi:hypothetical protein HDV05_008608 [Chytridiales sp. JEL 0842]|nr:hypothetical protein HDV05_008608 [Chytridiales sp. JEL 0842]